ncbi:Alpha-1,3/1,6-mannosyltransferase ALG2 [Nymphon striatum]|nr:Alpha-1,3/1,6-mannosyltransferase ALG2 [Nymphon striatum]
MPRVIFLHPDLGIGGAERLVVDAAVALKSKENDVAFITSHHDPNHSFAETKNGTIPVTVVGDWIPRQIFGFCHAMCAYIRMVYAAIYLGIFFSNIQYDLVICDQISVCIPVLKCKKNAKVLFYCHYPDLLLSKRNSWLKKLYRAPLDWCEEFTTRMADTILVNSHFTEMTVRKTFSSLSSANLQVLYPSLNFSAFDKPLQGSVTDFVVLKNVKTVFLSINRYERKKHLDLAIKAFGNLKSLTKPNTWKELHLIMAGGYDTRVKENVEHHAELCSLVDDLELSDKVTFLKSFTDDQKKLLLHTCTALLYTPENEHFGIVPIEAMYMARPVIAVNSGGPLETVKNDETGFLCDPTESAFAAEMLKFVKDKSLAREFGIYGKKHVQKNFSFTSFAEKLDSVTKSLLQSSAHSE